MSIKFSTATLVNRGMYLDRRDGIGKGCKWKVIDYTDARYKGQWDVVAERVLPGGEGFYVKRGMIYLALRVAGEKLTCSTARKADGDDQGLITDAELLKFKSEKLAAAHGRKEDDPAPGRSITVDRCFALYIAHLEKKHEATGEYATGERNSADRTDGFYRNHIKPAFGKLAVKNITVKMLKEYRSKREHDGASVPTINGEFRVLRAAINRAVKDGELSRKMTPDSYPIDNEGEKHSERQGTITEAQVQKIADVAAPHLKALFLTCVYTGLRPKEARFIRRSQTLLDGDDKSKTPRFEIKKDHKTYTKTRKPKIVGIPDELLPLLKEWATTAERDHPTCEWFFNYRGRRMGEPKTAWYAALKRAGIKPGKIVMYDARRTAATALDDAGVSMEDRTAQLGHSPIMASRYSQSVGSAERSVEARRKAKASTSSETPATATAPSNGVLDGLKELAGMLKEGLISRPEFDVLKSQLIGPQ